MSINGVTVPRVFTRNPDSVPATSSAPSAQPPTRELPASTPALAPSTATRQTAGETRERTLNETNPSNIRRASLVAQANVLPREADLEARARHLGGGQLRHAPLHIASGADSLPVAGRYAVEGTKNGRRDVDNYEAFALPRGVSADQLEVVYRSRSPKALVVDADAELARRYPGLEAGRTYLFINNGSNPVGSANIADVFVRR